MATIIRASCIDPDKIPVEICLTASLGEWKALRAVIVEQSEMGNKRVVSSGGGTVEPFWTLIHRLMGVIEKVEKQHSDY